MAETWEELPHQEALGFLRSLAPMTPAEILLYGEEAASRAFVVSGIYRLNVLQSMLDSMERALQGNETLEDFVERFAKTGLSGGRLETIFRTGMQTAYGRGQWDQGNDSDISEDIWGWRYHTVGDDAVREEHEALEGLVFEKGDGDEFFPPIDFNCRCSAEWITVLEAEEEGLETSRVPAGARDAVGETDFVSPALRDDLEPELGEYDLGLVREFLNEQREEG